MQVAVTGCSLQLSTILNDSSNDLLAIYLERLFQRLVSFTPESSLNFPLLRKFGLVLHKRQGEGVVLSC